VGKAFAFALSSAFNPTLFTAVMVMLYSARPRRLMLGYLFGAYTASITLGMVIVFALPDSDTVTTARNALTPAVDLALGLLALLIALVLGTGPHERVTERREKRKLKEQKKGPPRWRRALDTGSPRIAFVVGMALSLPGASYLIALELLHRQDLPTGGTALCVIAFCLIQMILLEIPVLGFALAPERTVSATEIFKNWISKDARRIAIWAALVFGVVLVGRGILELLR
jgi:Sap-like sulfolipid-1-addressing protein